MVSFSGAVLIIVLQSLLQPLVDAFGRRIHCELSRPIAQYHVSVAIEEQRFFASDTEDVWSSGGQHELVMLAMCDPVTSVSASGYRALMTFFSTHLKKCRNETTRWCQIDVTGAHGLTER